MITIRAFKIRGRSVNLTLSVGGFGGRGVCVRGGGGGGGGEGVVDGGGGGN